MKSIFSIVIILAGLSAQAAEKRFPKGTISARVLSGSLSEVKVKTNPNCPLNAFCVPVTTAKITYTLLGCRDHIGPVTSEVFWNSASGKYQVFLSALNLVNSESAKVKCFRAPIAEVEVAIGQGDIHKDQVEIVNLSNDSILSVTEL